MLPIILAPIIRLALWIYFRRIEVRGREFIPHNRPLIFVANHPNVMLDTLLLAAMIPGRKPHFLAKSTLFKRRLYAFFLRQLGALAVRRQQDGAHGGNRDMFRQACAVLQQDGALALFPEGGSRAGRQVHTLKPGAARIALHAAAAGAHQTCIVPVGLTYTAPELFRSDVELHFGPPIAVADFLATHQQNRQRAATQLTTAIHAHLVQLTWHLDSPALAQPIEDATTLYAARLADEFSANPHLSPHLRAGQALIRAAHHYAATEPALFDILSHRLRIYQRKIRRLAFPHPGLPDHEPISPQRPLLAIGLALPALYGLLHNALPYLLPRLCARSFQREPEMISTVKFAVGTAAFPLYYLLRTGVSGVFWGWPSALFYGLTLPLSGLLALYYRERILATIPLWKLWATPKRRRAHLEKLNCERRALLADLDQLKERYIAEALTEQHQY
ncbi:MAG: 1-acyl-sn-glycerol-3-phosphate acyltransferase [Candidatus Latescibacterota bacterium]|nr:1-acyl-sn-glycerol-3-phosphate acyltransferase [Candidatus Latescibacterota bacterium]